MSVKSKHGVFGSQRFRRLPPIRNPLNLDRYKIWERLKQPAGIYRYQFFRLFALESLGRLEFRMAFSLFFMGTLHVVPPLNQICLHIGEHNGTISFWSKHHQRFCF